MAHKEFCTCQSCTTSRSSANEPKSRREKNPLLARAVETQVGELTAPLAGWKGRKELPVTEGEYDRYDVAYASALRRCRHRAGVEPLASNSWRCVTCGQQFDMTTLPRRYREFWW